VAIPGHIAREAFDLDDIIVNEADLWLVAARREEYLRAAAGTV
jgi:hypothetical protein